MTTVTQSSALLAAEELPEHLAACYEFDTQPLLPHGNRNRRFIVRSCSGCGKKERVLVSIVRDAIKKGTLTGKCKSCAKKGRPQPTGVNAHQWKGGKRESPGGYVFLRRPNHPNAVNGYVFEHRVVMEQMLGRYLVAGETVHHKNGIKNDNRPDNLELWSNNHGSGVRYEDLTVTQLKDIVALIQDVIAAKEAHKPSI